MASSGYERTDRLTRIGGEKPGEVHAHFRRKNHLSWKNAAPRPRRYDECGRDDETQDDLAAWRGHSDRLFLLGLAHQVTLEKRVHSRGRAFPAGSVDHSDRRRRARRCRSAARCRNWLSTPASNDEQAARKRKRRCTEPERHEEPRLSVASQPRQGRLGTRVHHRRCSPRRRRAFLHNRCRRCRARRRRLVSLWHSWR
jgi:hypothetical protein